MLAGMLIIENGVPTVAAVSEYQNSTIENIELIQDGNSNQEENSNEESSSTESSSQEESASTESSSQEESSSQIVIEELTLNKSKLELEKGEEETLIVTILPEDYKGSKNVEWKSSNEEVVKVEVIKEKLPEES